MNEQPTMKSKELVKPPYSYIALIAMAINRLVENTCLE